MSTKVRSAPLFRTPFPSTSRKTVPPHYQFTFDPSLKGWRHTPREAAPSKWTKLKSFTLKSRTRGRQKATVLDIDVKALVKAAVQKRSLHLAAMQEDSGLKRATTEPNIINKPFPRVVPRNPEGVWVAPQSARGPQDRGKQFEWDRPKADRKKLVESASRYQAEYLQKTLQQREKELKLVAKQLMRTNQENYSLLKELEGYRGKNYEDLSLENRSLKQRLDSKSRENVILSGRLRMTGNRRLQR